MLHHGAQQFEAFACPETRAGAALSDSPRSVSTFVVRQENGASDGARTRDLRRDRPAL